jgi:hypothetical protein
MEPNKSRISAKDFFLHLGAMVALYVGTGALLNLLFTIINVAYPQTDRYFFVSSISLPVATLIVVFPLFLILANLIRKGYASDPAKKESGLRKWLVYITLFVSGLIIAGDLVTLIYYFLDGRELTGGFLLKVLSILVVAGSIFGYYVDDLRDRLTGSRRMMWRIIAGILVVGSIVSGFTVIGSPRTQRLARYDDQKVSDLQNIQSQILSYWQSKSALPQTLDDAQDPLSSYNYIPLDPQTGESYEYMVTGPLSFDLCATFNTSSTNMAEKPGYSSAYYYDGMENENWQHEEGRQCFSRAVDPDRYPPFKL